MFSLQPSHDSQRETGELIFQAYYFTPGFLSEKGAWRNNYYSGEFYDGVRPTSYTLMRIITWQQPSGQYSSGPDSNHQLIGFNALSVTSPLGHPVPRDPLLTWQLM